MAEKKRILSGAQSTGYLHLGNWEVLKNWARLQDEYDSYHFVANWHSLTTIKDRGDTDPQREYVRAVATDFIAGGLDPNRCTIFVQSDILGINLLTDNSPEPTYESLPKCQDVSTQNLPPDFWQLSRLVMLKQARRLLVLL